MTIAEQHIANEPVEHIESPPISFESALAGGMPVLVALTEEIAAGRELPALSPDQVDRAVAEYQASEVQLSIMEDGHKKLKQALIALVKAHGAVPPHAEQSRRLLGKRSVATVTIGTTINVNEEAVEVLSEYLENYLGKESGFNVFKRLFAANTKHQLVDGARNVLAQIGFPQRAHEKVLSLFGRCIDPKPKAPSLKVELITPEKPARKPRAGKAAA